MKLLFGSVLIIIAGFSVNKHVFSSKAYDGVTTVTDVTVSDCLSHHDEKKLECEIKVFRLAPQNLESEREVLNYSREYTQCTLPYKYILG